MVKRFILSGGLILGILAISPAYATLQVRSNAQAEALPGSPSLTAQARGIHDERFRRDLTLERFDVSVRRHGATVALTYVMRFTAPEEGTEGRLSVDLPDGAVVTGYALDIEGRMIEGALVDQAGAREAFDTLVRGQIDPGLAEVTRDGAFTTRVFPVGPDGRTIRLDFVAPASDEFALPIRLAENAGDWRFFFEGDPGVRLTTRRTSGRGSLDTVIKVEPGEEGSVLASRHPVTNETYWQVSGKALADPSEEIENVRIFWDRSRSRLADDHRSALRTVENALARWRPRSITFAPFDYELGEPVRLADARALETIVAQVDYGGASRFDWMADQPSADACILVTDGQATLGHLDVIPDCPTLVVATREGAASAALSAMADRSGGRLVDAGDDAPSSLSGVRFTTNEGRPVLHRSLPAPEGRLRAIVKAPLDQPIMLHQAGRSHRYEVPSTISPIDQDSILFEAVENGILDAGIDREAFLAHSRRYGIASPSLPFLVLESVEDYVRFKVAPRSDHPQIVQYKRLREEAEVVKAEARQDRMASVLRDWQAEVDWWQADYDAPRFSRSTSEEQRQESTEALPPPPPPPPPAPPPPPPQPAPEPQSSRISEAAAAAPGGDQTVDRLGQDSGIRIAVTAHYPDRDWIEAYDSDPPAFDDNFAIWQAKVGDRPAFYLDSANWLWLAGRKNEAIRVLLSALDTPLADVTTMSMVAGRLEAWGKHSLAVVLRERIADQIGHRPQPSRFLALALAQRADVSRRTDPESAQADYARAVELLSKVALEPLDARWDGIDIVALREANAIIPRLEALGGSHNLDPRLVANLHADFRVTAEWSTDANDIDLHVTEPTGEQVYYSNRTSAAGGRLSDDMTSGFGPEEYWIRRAPGGTFEVAAKTFSGDRLNPNGAPRLRVKLIRDFGRPAETVEYVDLEMDGTSSGVVPIARFRIGPAEIEPGEEEAAK